VLGTRCRATTAAAANQDAMLGCAALFRTLWESTFANQKEEQSKN